MMNSIGKNNWAFDKDYQNAKTLSELHAWRVRCIEAEKLCDTLFFVCVVLIASFVFKAVTG